MVWVWHGGNRYYYRGKKINGKVVMEYVGKGIIGEIAEAEDLERRRLKADKQQRKKNIQQEETAIDQHLIKIEADLTVITSDLLKSAGFHKHRGQWRQRRAR